MAQQIYKIIKISAIPTNSNLIQALPIPAIIPNEKNRLIGGAAACSLF